MTKFGIIEYLDAENGEYYITYPPFYEFNSNCDVKFNLYDCERLLQNFKTLTPEHIQYVIDLIVTNSGTKYGPFTPLNRIIGSVVLYDYILDHGDNFVVIINYSSGGADSPKMTKARSDLGLYNARFCNPARLGLEGTINVSLEKNYFGFSIDKSAVRVQLGL